MTPPALASAISFSRPSLRADSSARDMALLRNHLQSCGRQNDRWSDVRTAAASVHHFFAPRFATTLTLLLVVIVSVSMAV